MSKENEAVILSAARTPIARFQGGLSSMPGTKLGAVAVKAAVERAGIENKADIDEVFMGMVVPAGQGQAPARQAAIFAGLPATVSATAFNKVCGSGLKTAMLAAQAVKAGDGQLFVSGGMESMTRAPYLVPGRTGEIRYGHVELKDSLLLDGLWDPFEDWAMGNAADFIAEEYEVTREAMDRYAAESHQKAVAAIEAGKFKDEIVPVEITGARARSPFSIPMKAHARIPPSNRSPGCGLSSAPMAGSQPGTRPA
jgi:acetyl-CoA C-acetyltransferase